LEPILDGLYRNPYGFNLIENDWVKVRYVVTKPTSMLPNLVVIFRIEPNNDVTLLHVEEYEPSDDQHKRFIETARALECDEDKERFEEKLRRIATVKPKPPKSPTDDERRAPRSRKQPDQKRD
jgi:hypothetical protein